MGYYFFFLFASLILLTQWTFLTIKRYNEFLGRIFDFSEFIIVLSPGTPEGALPGCLAIESEPRKQAGAWQR